MLFGLWLESTQMLQWMGRERNQADLNSESGGLSGGSIGCCASQLLPPHSLRTIRGAALWQAAHQNVQIITIEEATEAAALRLSRVSIILIVLIV